MCCGRQAPLGPLNQNAVKILNKTHCTQSTHTVSTLVYTVSVLSCLSACVLIKCRILLIKSNNAQRGSNAIKNASNSSAWAERHAKWEREREREWKREHTIVRAVRALSLRGLTSLSLSPSPDAAACCQARAKATAIFWVSQTRFICKAQHKNNNNKQ